MVIAPHRSSGWTTPSTDFTRWTGIRRCIHGIVVTGNSRSHEITSPCFSRASTMMFMPLDVFVVRPISSGSALMKAATFARTFALREPLVPAQIAFVLHLLV